MITILTGVLDPHETAALGEAASGLHWEDGKKTAGRYTKDVKKNAQAADTPAREAVTKKVREALMAHETFRSAARPKIFARLLVSRYGPGDAFGMHIDDPIMLGHRTDMSFTLFLSPEDTYEGGGLVLEDGIEERVIKLPPGDAVLYPTSALHQVEPISSGQRLAVVGWVTSRVRDPGRREILFDLDHAASEMFAATGKTRGFDRLLKAKSNLYRMWAED